MVQVNPKLLQEVRKPQRLQRTSQGVMTGLIKNVVSSMFNGNAMQEELQKMSKFLETLVLQQKTITVGKASLDTQKIDEFRVNNLEELKLENVESLSFALEQLEPIIESLALSNKSDAQAQKIFNTITEKLTSLSSEMAKLAKKELTIPDTQKVTGSVSVINMPESSQLAKLINSFSEVKLELSAFMKAMPKENNKIELAEGKMIEEKLDKLVSTLENLPDNMNFPSTVEVTNFPPQKYPMPVTHISINSLGGTVKSRAITVNATTPTPLPDEVLAYRRSLVIYNNSSTVILYVGGSDVTATNGMPVPPSSYSPSFDAGPKMIVYGIAASSTINVRVIEASDENSGR